MSEEKKPVERTNRYSIQIAAIQEAALDSANRDLTYQQAMSILLRSGQLKKEERANFNAAERMKQREVDESYWQRYGA